MKDELIRVSDAERESVAERLRKAHADGRLDTAELEERIERCYAAKTRAELDPLVADLPGARARRASRPAVRTGAFALSPLLVLAVLLTVFVFSGAAHYPFPLLPILFFVFFRFGIRRRHRYR